MTKTNAKAAAASPAHASSAPIAIASAGDVAALKAARLFDMTGKTVVVTGAAGGLGLAIAEVMAANGAHVTMIDANAATLETSAKRLADAGLAVAAVALDVTESSSLIGTITSAAARTGRLDAVFANAGISAGPGFGSAPNQSVGRLDQIDLRGWDHVLAVNLTAVMHTLQAAAASMKARGGGRIVVTASIAGVRAEPFVGYAYASAKAAVINLVRQAATELAPHKVLVNCIAPGFLHTDIGNGRLHDAEVRTRLAATVPMGRIGAASEIQGLALYLASSACSYMTGVCVPVDGGLLAR